MDSNQEPGVRRLSVLVSLINGSNLDQQRISGQVQILTLSKASGKLQDQASNPLQAQIP